MNNHVSNPAFSCAILQSSGLESDLANFTTTAETGQLFLLYFNHFLQPHDHIVKITSNSQHPRLSHLSWEMGNHYIEFKDIYFIDFGCFTPILKYFSNYHTKKQSKFFIADPNLCFSIVCIVTKNQEKYYQTLNIQAPTLEIAQLWVHGLRRLINQTPEQAQTLRNKFVIDIFDTNPQNTQITVPTLGLRPY